LISELLNPEAQKFIKDHEGEDPASLMLKPTPSSDFPLRSVVQQIRARQKARTKLPDWYKTPGLIFAPGIPLEQSSSQITAQLKSSFFRGEWFLDFQ